METELHDRLVSFELDSDALDELKRAAAIEGRDYHLQARVFVLKAMSISVEYDPKKKPAKVTAALSETKDAPGKKLPGAQSSPDVTPGTPGEKVFGKDGRP